MALKFHLDSLEMKKRLFKTDHPDISKSLNNIGNAYSCLEKHEMAIKILQRIISYDCAKLP